MNARLESECMSDYLFMLENHLSTDQNRVVAEVQAAASVANFNLFLTGGAMRDMLGGFQIRDLDFTVEGNALKLAKTLTAKAGAKVLSLEDNRRTMELVFPAGVTVEIGMARRERYPKIGGRPVVTPSTIQDDLHRRDFSVNAIALSLNRASRGLLLDPLNGLADLGRKELRTISPTAFYDDPPRLLRLVRLRHRLGYAVEEKTQSQYENARAANNAVGQETVRRLAEKIQEVDKKRESDNRLIQDTLARLQKSLTSPSLAAPKAPRTETPPTVAAASAKAIEYQVKQGDRLDLIVKDVRDQGVKVTLKQVRDANPNINWDKLKVGQKIFIPLPVAGKSSE